MKAYVKALLARAGLLEHVRRVRRSLVPGSRQRAAAREYAQHRGVDLAFDSKHIAIRKDTREIRISLSCGRGPCLVGMVDHFDYHHSAVVPKTVNGLTIADFSRPQVHRLTSFGVEVESSGVEVELSFQETFIAICKGNREIRINPSHDVYVWDTGNFFDHYHSAVTPTMRNGVAVVDYSRPQVHRLTRSGLEFEFPSLPESDESTEAYLAALNLQPGDVVLDLGAYVGASAYFLAQAVGPTGLIASFEPDEATFRCLEANVARHRLANVKTFQKGIWSETTTLAFQSEGNLGSSVVQIVGRDSNVKTIDVVTLDDAAALAGGKRVAAVKMDIEGAELAVLKNASDFLRRHRPTLIVEAHFVDGRLDAEEVCEFLRSNDYSVDFVSQNTGDRRLIGARPNSPTA